jgi:hypothetical protein
MAKPNENAVLHPVLVIRERVLTSKCAQDKRPYFVHTYGQATGSDAAAAMMTWKVMSGNLSFIVIHDLLEVVLPSQPVCKIKIADVGLPIVAVLSCS